MPSWLWFCYVHNLIFSCSKIQLEYYDMESSIQPQTYLLNQVCLPIFSLPLWTCLEHDVLQIVIITLFRGSKNIPNLIILLSLDLLSLKIKSHCLLSSSFVMLPIWNSNIIWSLLLCRLLLLWWYFLMLLQNVLLLLL